MRRMPRDFFIHFQTACKVFFFALFSISVLTFAHPAYADPHAVFYTDRAQEQFFYNSLAALNQADFVEPGTGTYSRGVLLDRRTGTAQQPQPIALPSTPPFAGDENPLVTSTKTDLPAILSRSITLEGYDLWTAYLVNQLALETKTRRSISELARIYCTNGLGREGCSTNPGRSQQQETAFINDSATYNPEILALAGGLSDGTAEEDSLRKRLTQRTTSNESPDENGAAVPATTPIPNSLKVPRPSFSDIAKLRENNKGKTGNLGFVNNIIGGVISAYFNSGIDSEAINEVTVNEDGTVEIPEDISFEKYIQIASGLGSILHGSIDNAAIALEEGEKARRNREDTRSLADTVLARDNSGAVKAIVQAPSTTKEELIASQATLIANSDIHQKSVATKEITIPGNAPALPVQQTTLESSSNTQAALPNQPNGQVAGIISDLYDKYYRDPSPSTNNPNTGLVPPHEEGGTYEALQALTGDRGIRENPNDIDKQCGFCIALDTIIGQTQQGLQGTLDVIQGIYNDIYCVFFPTMPACTKKDA